MSMNKPNLKVMYEQNQAKGLFAGTPDVVVDGMKGTSSALCILKMAAGAIIPATFIFPKEETGVEKNGI